MYVFYICIHIFRYSYILIGLREIFKNIKILGILTVQKGPDRVYQVPSQAECPIFMCFDVFLEIQSGT